MRSITIIGAGIDMTHVPYSGSGPAVRDTIAGHVDLTFTAGGMTYADRAKVLGVTSAKRTSAAPQVPAIAESVPGYQATIFFGSVTSLAIIRASRKSCPMIRCGISSRLR